MVISIRGGKYWLWRAVDNEGEVLDFLVQGRRDAPAARKLMVKLLKKHGFAPSRVVTDRLRSYPAAFRAIGLTAEHDQGLRANNRAERYDAENENCSGSNHPAQPNVSSPSMPPHSTHSPINVICCADRISRSFAPVHSALGPRHPTPHDACCPLHSPRLNADNVTKPDEGLAAARV
jgi:IS1 family transposase